MDCVCHFLYTYIYIYIHTLISYGLWAKSVECVVVKTAFLDALCMLSVLVTQLKTDKTILTKLYTGRFYKKKRNLRI
jgi:hypothetical protein